MKRIISLFLLAMLFLPGMPTAYAAFKPRTSRCETPKNIPAEPGKLPAAIPFAYTKGSLLAMEKDRMAYADHMDTMKFTVESRSNKTKIFSDWSYDDLAAIIIDGSTVICLEGGLYTDNMILRRRDNL